MGLTWSQGGTYIPTYLFTELGTTLLKLVFFFSLSSTFLIEGVLGSKTYLAKVDGSTERIVAFG